MKNDLAKRLTLGLIFWKLGVAFGIGFVYSYISFASMIAGGPAIVRRGFMGGIAAGAGVALGMGIYSTAAIVGIALVQFFLLPEHLAILEIALGILLAATGLIMLSRKPKRKRNKSFSIGGSSLTFFFTTLSITLSAPQKIAYIAGLFLYFNLHLTTVEVKAMIPFSVSLGVMSAWALYTLVVLRAKKHVTALKPIQNKIKTLSHISHCRMAVSIRNFATNRHTIRKAVKFVFIVMFFIGLFLTARGIRFFC